jgi:dTMP kinase
MTTRGKLITFEGIDGCGKSTQSQLLQAHLRAQGLACVTTREPGGTALGRRIRSVLLDVTDEPVEPLAELLLFAADRAQHVRQLIQPALAAGQIVLSDRFYDATMAYQGYARGHDRALVRQIIELATGGLKPDLTLLFDLDVATGWQRVHRRSTLGSVPAQAAEAPDRLDREPTAFHEQVRQGYLAIAAQEPERVRIIPAAGDIEKTYALMMAEVQKLLTPHSALRTPHSS